MALEVETTLCDVAAAVEKEADVNEREKENARRRIKVRELETRCSRGKLKK